MRVPRLLLLLPLLGLWLAWAARCGGYGSPPPPADPAQRPRPLGLRSQLVEPGRLQVEDGDTLRLGSRTLRLLGIDTPERGAPWFRGDQEPWAGRARAFVQERLASARRVELRSRGRLDRYGRELVWLLLDGVPLAALLAEAGLGYPTGERFGPSDFPELTRAVAARARAPAFEPPWRWRTRQRR